MGRREPFCEADEVVLAQPPQVTVVSTVGAGDAMVSGTVAAKRWDFLWPSAPGWPPPFGQCRLSGWLRLPSLEVIEKLKVSDH
jgi:hypothetical protein